MMNAGYLRHPIDPVSAERLAAQHLRLDLLDTGNADSFAEWLHADARGFHGSRTSSELIEANISGLAYRRTTGVWDDSAAEPASPVSTVSSWPVELTVPGGSSVTGWAISAVTVAPTHRRRGVARAMLEAELRTAHELGVPLAMLTVSEATIYGRYGFAPAAMMADWSIDTRRARWTGPAASGRIHFVPLEQLRGAAPALFERVRLAVPGQIEAWDYLWDRMLALEGDDKEFAKRLRAVRYDDSDGVPQGFAIYTVTGSPHDFSTHVLDVPYLLAATDDAYAGLWRYLLEMDLVGTVTAPLRSIDEPVLWQISDPRAARKTAERDHLWVRILDVAASLEARNYSAPGQIVLEVEDPLGFAAGRFLVSIAPGGSASVAPFDGEIPENAAALALTVNELSALYLGGVSARSLECAGRITALRPGSTDIVDTCFRSPIAPWLSLWF